MVQTTCSPRWICPCVIIELWRERLPDYLELATAVLGLCAVNRTSPPHIYIVLMYWVLTESNISHNSYKSVLGGGRLLHFHLFS